ncbi:hypothetical protein TBK1r_13270 [Stieleria magnilauensis]|uniref:Uncharacterized protein n=1 Tax=Stieleria magnilauensis TaxID=2527963 RepID=A0ABX5XL26_9BACT|nr:hypothetical protein TBK1r_13270 [Planctomycetes bacterium TBK1r]
MKSVGAIRAHQSQAGRQALDIRGTSGEEIVHE